MGPTLTAILRGAPQRRRLAHNDYSGLTYTDFHPDGHPSESTAYMSSTLTAIREKQPSPEKRGHAHNNCSESTYTGLHPDDHPSESTAYTGPTLTTISQNLLKNKDPRHHTGASRAVIQHPKKWSTCILITSVLTKKGAS